MSLNDVTEFVRSTFDQPRARLPLAVLVLTVLALGAWGSGLLNKLGQNTADRMTAHASVPDHASGSDTISQDETDPVAPSIRAIDCAETKRGIRLVMNNHNLVKSIDDSQDWWDAFLEDNPNDAHDFDEGWRIVVAARDALPGDDPRKSILSQILNDPRLRNSSPGISAESWMETQSVAQSVDINALLAKFSSRCQ